MIDRHVQLDKQWSYWETHKNKRGYQHPVVEFFAKQRIQYINEFVNLKDIKSAFDYGCGDGFSSYYMAQFVAHVEGGDISEYLLRHNPLGRKYLHVIDGCTIPFPDNSFEMVYCWEVLHHAEHPERVVKEMARVASRYVVIFEPNGFNPAQLLFGLFKKEERGTLRFNKSYLMYLAHVSQLKILHHGNVGWIFPNVTPGWLFRLLKHFPFEFPGITISSCLVAEKVALK